MFVQTLVRANGCLQMFVQTSLKQRDAQISHGPLVNINFVKSDRLHDDLGKVYAFESDS